MSLKGYLFVGMLAVLMVCAGSMSAAAQETKAEPAEKAEATAASSNAEAAGAETSTTQAGTASHVTSGVTAAKQAKAKRVTEETDTKVQEPEYKTPPNVIRIDNLKNKRKVKPVAVIKTPACPWGYTSRYLAGQISRPKNPGLNLPGAQGYPGAGGMGMSGMMNNPYGGGMSARQRHEDDEDY